MHKKFIALAVAGLVSAPVLAQSNVTIYGVADAYFGYGKYAGNKLSAINSGGLSGSRLGFRGKEDLGNGLNAVFTLEYALGIDGNSGVGTGGARQQFVGLEGGFGFVGLGRQYAPGYFVFKYDAVAGSGALSPHAQLAGAAGAMINASSASRINNSINYKSPKMNGFSVNAIYGFNEANQLDNRRKNDVFGLGLEYGNGPVALGLTWQQKDGGSDPDQKEWMLGATYDFGAAKLLASYQQVKDVIGSAGETDKLFQIGTIVPVGAGNIHLAWGKLDADAGSDYDIKSWVLAYTHALSKRTTVYTGWLRVDNGSNTARSSLANNKDEFDATVFGKNSDAFVLGLRHTF